jgi:hypothetical protein
MSKAFLRDLAERVATTFVEAFLAAWLASQAFDQFSFSVLRMAALAGLVAAASVIKNALGSLHGSSSSGSLLADDLGPVGSTGTGAI